MLFLCFNKKESDFVYGLKIKPIKAVVQDFKNKKEYYFKEGEGICIFNIDGKIEEILAWKRILKTAGIPYLITTDFDKCGNDKKFVIIVKNPEKVSQLSEKEEIDIKNFVKNGGIVIGDGIFSLKFGQLKDLFGYKNCIPSKKRKKMTFIRGYENKYLNEPEERDLTFSHKKESIWTNGIILGTAKPLAFFEDKNPAITVNEYGKGKAILLGFSAFDLVLRNLSNRDFQANAKYINHFEPLSDILVFFIKDLYEKIYPQGFTIYTAPYGFKATFIITHDIDSTAGVKNLRKFVELENKLRCFSTIFVQTKYMLDYNDKPFFTPEFLKFLLELYKKGFEIGSHTVIHSKLISRFPLGDCKESYPFYKPKVTGKYEVLGHPTLCGELKVSKELLEGSGIEIFSFRPGNLEYNYDLPLAMEKTGYKFSSTFSAENVLTYFPFKLLYKDYSGESSIIEIPVALEDELFPPLYFRFDAARDLFKKIYYNGGVMVLLIHTDLTWFKPKNIKILTFLEKFVKSLPADTWITTIGKVGEFWRKREEVQFSCKLEGKKLVIKIYSPFEIEGLTFKKNSSFTFYTSNENLIVKEDFLIFKKIPAGISKWVLDLSG